jgi:5-methylcytosine-specific restriction endonuclease McrA
VGNALAKFAKNNRRRDLPQRDVLPPGEEKALKKLQQEAKQRGATLATGGKGGLPASLVLGVMRRDKYHCKVCGTNKDLSLHHVGGIVSSPRVSRMGHSNQMNNIITVCPSCHDRMHQEAREKGIDSSQVTPIGDR